METFALVMTLISPDGESMTRKSYWPSEEACIGMTQAARFSISSQIVGEGLDPNEFHISIHCEPFIAEANEGKSGRVRR